MSEAELFDSRSYQWAINSDPDFLILQPAPAPVFSAGGSSDGLKTALREFGFVALESLDQAQIPRVQATLSLTLRTGFLSLGPQGGVMARYKIPHDDSDWACRILSDNECSVLVTESVLDGDGRATQERLERDLVAGALLGGIAAVRRGR